MSFGLTKTQLSSQTAAAANYSQVARWNIQDYVKPWEGKNRETLPGYWLLGSLGKKVLRPGGIALSRRMIQALDISETDSVVEYAPGLGITAALTLDRFPRSYLAIEKDKAAAAMLQGYLDGRRNDAPWGKAEYRCIAADAAEGIDIPSSSATVVYGESMLTIHSQESKEKILREVYRMLKPGGRFGFQEISLFPSDIEPDTAHTIRRDVIQAVRHPAWPLTVGQWANLVTQAGFIISVEMKEPVLLLEHDRLVEDEGLDGAAQFLQQVQEDPVALRRVHEIRSVFRKYRNHLCALSMVARKPELTLDMQKKRDNEYQ